MEQLPIASGHSLLVITDDPTAAACATVVAQATAVGATTTVWAVEGVEERADEQAQKKGKKSKFDFALLVNVGASDDVFAAVFGCLAGNATARVVQQAADAPAGKKAEIVDALLLGGFDVPDSGSSAGEGAAAAGVIVIDAVVPSWSGQAAMLPKATTEAAVAAAAGAGAGAAPGAGAAADPRALFASLANDFDDSAHDAVDEDALLGEAPTVPKRTGCAPAAPGTRKRACKNCTCGSFLFFFFCYFLVSSVCLVVSGGMPTRAGRWSVALVLGSYSYTHASRRMMCCLSVCLYVCLNEYICVCMYVCTMHAIFRMQDSKTWKATLL